VRHFGKPLESGTLLIGEAAPSHSLTACWESQDFKGATFPVCCRRLFVAWRATA